MVDLCDHVDSLLLVGVSLEVHVAALVSEAWIGFLFLFLNMRGENTSPNHLPKVKLFELLTIGLKEHYLPTHLVKVLNRLYAIDFLCQAIFDHLIVQNITCLLHEFIVRYFC